MSTRKHMYTHSEYKNEKAIKKGKGNHEITAQILGDADKESMDS